MRRILCILLLVTWSSKLHADEKPTNPQSALPSLRLESLSVTRDRPLFSPSRRRAPVQLTLPATNTGTSEPAGPPFSLTGIIVSDSQTLVLLRDNATSELRTVRSGESVGHWHVLVDSNFAVKLKNGAEEIKLEMFAPQ